MSTSVDSGRVDVLALPDGARQPGSPRVVGLDVARALAVFGMFGAHVGVVAEDVGASPSTWTGVVNGRSSILFAVLAGTSIALLSGGTRPVAGDDLVRARVRILVRAAWVFAIGGVLDALGTGIAVILGVYAVLFVLALPFLRWPARRLLLAAGALALLAPPADLFAEQFVDATGSYDGPFVVLAVSGTYPAVVWWTFVLVGLAVGRSDLRSRRVRAAVGSAGVALAVAGYTGGWVSTRMWGGTLRLDDAYQSAAASDLAWLSGAAPHSGTTFEIVGSVGVALTVIAVSLVISDRLPTAVLPLAAVGSMALTAYAGSVVAVWVTGTHHDDDGAWAGYVLATLVTCTAWRLVLGRGPLERLLTWSSTRAAVPGGGMAQVRAEDG